MKKLLKIKEVAKELGLKYNTVLYWIKKKKLIAKQFGGKNGTWYITRKDLEKFLAS